MEDLNDKELRLVVHHFSCLSLFIIRIEVEPALKVVSVVEYCGHHEVQQTPQLHNIVLKRCPSKKQPAIGLNLAG